MSSPKKLGAENWIFAFYVLAHDIKMKAVQEILISYPFNVTNVKLNDISLPYANTKQKKDNPVTFSMLYTNLKLPDPPYNFPIVSVTITKEEETSKFNCSFDSGSQRSYFSKRDTNKLGYNKSDPAPEEFKIKHFKILK